MSEFLPKSELLVMSERKRSSFLIVPAKLKRIFIMSTPKISNQEFARRRHHLTEMMAANSVAVLPAAPVYIRNRDVEHYYRQDSDFYYLTGFAEPEAVLVIMPGRDNGDSILFCRDRDETKEQWEGYRLGPERASQVLGVDDAFPIGDIDDILPGLLEGRDRIYYQLGANTQFDQQVLNWINSVSKKSQSSPHGPGEIVALSHLLHEQRLFKSSAEIKVMQHAANISARAHAMAMKVVKPGMFEYQLEAEFDYEFTRSGCRRSAYAPIVGSGNNGCILHYVDNNQVIKDGDLILIDAGCEFDYYASDITRTFPANGRFSEEQRILYDIVLAAQQAAIDAVTPINNWDEPHQAAVKVLTEGLLDVGILHGSLPDLLENEAYKPFYMHRTGHWLGMDVHDVGDYKLQDQWRQLEPGMVLTVEPGLYIADDNQSVDAKWRGIGIRIEDDVVVTKDKPKVLSQQVVKKAEDIEQLMAG